MAKEKLQSEGFVAKLIEFNFPAEGITVIAKDIDDALEQLKEQIKS